MRSGSPRAGNFRDPHTGYSGNILHLVDRTEDPSPEITDGARPALRPARDARAARARRQGAARLERAVPPFARRSRGRVRPGGLDGRGARPTRGSSARRCAARTAGCSGRGTRRSGGRHLAVAEDYAALLEAYVTLAEVDDVAWLTDARWCADELFRLFHDEESGGFFTTGSDAEPLIVRPAGLLRQRDPVRELARGRRAAAARRDHRRRLARRLAAPAPRPAGRARGPARRASPSCSAPTSGRSPHRSRSRSSATTRAAPRGVRPADPGLGRGPGRARHRRGRSRRCSRGGRSSTAGRRPTSASSSPAGCRSPRPRPCAPRSTPPSPNAPDPRFGAHSVAGRRDERTESDVGVEVG